MFEFFEEGTDGSSALGGDVFLAQREKLRYVGRFQVLLIGFRVHLMDTARQFKPYQ